MTAPPAPPPCQHSYIDIEDLLAFGHETQWLDGTCAKCDALLRVNVAALEVNDTGVVMEPAEGTVDSRVTGERLWTPGDPGVPQSNPEPGKSAQKHNSGYFGGWT